MGGGKEGGRSKETCQREGGGAEFCARLGGATDVKARPVPQNTMGEAREEKGLDK